MRKPLSFLSLTLCALLLTGCAEPERQSFSIHGTIPGLPAGVEIGLLDAEDRAGSSEIATATVQKDGEFLLEGRVEHPLLCTLTTNNLAMLGDEVEAGNYERVKWTYTPVFVDNSDMTIQVPAYDLVPDAPESREFHIVGSPSHDDYCEYVALAGGADDAAPRFDTAMQFFKAHPTSVVSFYVANRMLTNGYNLTAEQIRQLQEMLTACPADMARFTHFVERAKTAEATATGNPVVDLDLVTPDGTRCQLAEVVKSHAGKFLLIDFWASWCGICRASTPAIKELYDTLPRTQFEVISVSCDEKDEAWRAAMEKDQMPWAQYCLTPDGYKDFFAKYQLIGVPYYLLVNAEGKVIANPERVEDIQPLVVE